MLVMCFKVKSAFGMESIQRHLRRPNALLHTHTNTHAHNTHTHTRAISEQRNRFLFCSGRNDAVCKRSEMNVSMKRIWIVGYTMSILCLECGTKRRYGWPMRMHFIIRKRVATILIGEGNSFSDLPKIRSKIGVNQKLDFFPSIQFLCSSVRKLVSFFLLKKSPIFSFFNPKYSKNFK